MIRIMYGDVDVGDTLVVFVVWMHDGREWALVDPFPIPHATYIEMRDQPEIVALIDGMRRVSSPEATVLDFGLHTDVDEAYIEQDPQAWAEALWTRTAA